MNRSRQRTTTMRDSRKMEQLQVPIAGGLKRQLKVIAAKRGVSLRDLVAGALVDWLARQPEVSQ